MSESFLHYIWQFQYFSKSELLTSAGETITIFHPGIPNTHAGPDFQQARVRIGGIEWIGSVEIHIQASSWYDHKHNHDKRYENVILHVVWQNDRPVNRIDGSEIPTMELSGRVEDRLLFSYKKLVNSPHAIPCAGALQGVSEIKKNAMIDKALVTRLESRTRVIHELLKRNGNDWEETCYQLMARSFGFKVNAEPLLRLAKGLPLKVLLKHADRIEQVEALLFGQAGLFEYSIFDDDYQKVLKREYQLLCTKYQLGPSSLTKDQWKFLRMRPANFPTIRIAQLAMLIHQQRNFFSRFLQATCYNELQAILDIQQSPYWQTHFHFGKSLKQEVPSLGTESINMIIINTVVPLMVASGKIKDEQYLVDRAINMLHQVPPESNTITRQWEALGIQIGSAFDSQGLIELHQNFCMKRRCLECAIGVSLVKPV
jgi:hypothetical protein